MGSGFSVSDDACEVAESEACSLIARSCGLSLPDGFGVCAARNRRVVKTAGSMGWDCVV